MPPILPAPCYVGVRTSLQNGMDGQRLVRAVGPGPGTPVVQLAWRGLYRMPRNMARAPSREWDRDTPQIDGQRRKSMPQTKPLTRVSSSTEGLL